MTTRSRQRGTSSCSTPLSGIAVVDVAKIGTAGLEPEIVGPAVRGGYFARRSREIYYGSRGGARNARSTSTRSRRAKCTHARGLINADETLSVVKNGKAVDAEGNTLARRCARSFRNCSGCFPASAWKTSRPTSSIP